MTDNLAQGEVSLEKIERYRRVSIVLWLVLFLNIIVSAGKIMLGMSTGLLSVFADGLHSLSDSASNILGLIGIRLARQPNDFDHPYGHRRYETLASLGIGFMLILLSFHLFGDAYQAFRAPKTHDVTAVSFVVMVATMLINIFVVLFERKQGEILKSDLLRADAMHTATDVIVTISVIAGLVLIRLGWTWMDPLVTVGVALVILRVALNIIKQSSDVLCDHIVLDAEDVRRAVSDIPGIKDCHMVRSRGRSDDVQVDMHILVPDGMDVKSAHELAHRVEDRVRERFPGVSDVVVHVEPESSVDDGHF